MGHFWAENWLFRKKNADLSYARTVAARFSTRGTHAQSTESKAIVFSHKVKQKRLNQSKFLSNRLYSSLTRAGAN